MEESHLIIHEALCGYCGGCVSVCAFDAILIDADGIRELPGRCTACNLCVITCPSRALVLCDEIEV